MKNLLVIVFVLFALSSYAQEKAAKEESNKTEQMTPEQKSQLQLKKMILELDLNEKQQKELRPIIAEMNAKQETHKAEMKTLQEKGEKPTANQRFEMQNKKLDNTIEMKNRISKILTPEQMEKWMQINQKKGRNRNGGCMNPSDNTKPN